MRASIEQYAMNVAQVVSSRSEDPWNQVGAVALTVDNRIIATAYNGLLPGFDHAELMKWLLDNNPGANEEKLREMRLPYMVHAEQNLCSLIKRYEACWAAITIRPCRSCLLALASNGIKRIICGRNYDREDSQPIAHYYGVIVEVV